MKKNEKLKKDRMKNIIEDIREYYESCQEKSVPLQ